MRKYWKILALFAVLLALPFLRGCSNSALFIANTLAAMDDYEVARDIRYGEATDEVLDVYQPAGADKRPVVVFFYGGCWGACMDYTRESYEFVAQAFTSQGYVVVVPDYQHYPDTRYAGIMQSAASTARWVKNNIAEYGGDPERVLLSGHSAGAHMAAMLIMDEQWLVDKEREAFSGFIGFAGPYDFLPLTEDYQYELFGPEENYPASQPINFVDGNEPPMLLLHGTDDTKVRPKNTRNLAIRLLENNSPVLSYIYEGIGHADMIASLARPLRDRKPVMEDINNFLQQVAPLQNSSRQSS